MALLYMSCVSQQQLGTPDCHLYPFPNSTAEPYQLYLYGTLPVDRMEDSTRATACPFSEILNAPGESLSSGQCTAKRDTSALQPLIHTQVEKCGGRTTLPTSNRRSLGTWGYVKSSLDSQSTPEWLVCLLPCQLSLCQPAVVQVCKTLASDRCWKYHKSVSASEMSL